MRIRSLLSAALLAALVAGCGTASTSGGAAATVDGETVPRETLEDAVRDLTEAGPDLGADERNEAIATTQRQVLGFLIQAQAIFNVAEERGVSVSEEDEEARYQQDIEQVGGEEQLAQTLASQPGSVTLDLYRDVLIPASLRMDALGEQLAEDMESEEVDTRTVRHILVETEPEAQAIINELEAGADFAELAQERSIDTGSGAQGGELGANPAGTFVPPFEEAVWSAEVGEIVGPIESQFGFHVIEVTETGTREQAPGGGSLQEAALMEVQQLLAEEIAAADISVAPGLGRWDAETGQVVAPERVGEGADPAQQPMPGAEQPLDESGDAPAGE